jgi:uncharacterized protein YcfJ
MIEIESSARRNKMNKTPAYTILLGLLLGAIVGWGLGIVNGNAIHGMQLGALSGTFIGWFVAAAAMEKGKKEGK